MRGIHVAWWRRSISSAWRALGSRTPMPSASVYGAGAGTAGDSSTAKASEAHENGVAIAAAST